MKPKLNLRAESKYKSIQYRSESSLQAGTRSSKDILNFWPGCTRYGTSRIRDELSAFRLFITKDIEKIVILNSTIEGKRVFGSKWKEIDSNEFSADLFSGPRWVCKDSFIYQEFCDLMIEKRIPAEDKRINLQPFANYGIYGSIYCQNFLIMRMWPLMNS